MSHTKPLLLSITLYSVLVLQVVLLLASSTLVFLKSEMEELQSFIGSGNGQLQSPWILYLLLFLILVSILSVILMLRRKIVGVYIFSIFSIIITIFILLGEPIEFLNIFMLIIINYVFYMYRSWFVLINEEILVEKEHKENINR